MTGLFTAFGVLAALRHRDATGEGQWIDASLYESAFRVMEYTTTLYGRRKVVRERGGLQHAGWPGGAFETHDGRWIVFTAPAQHLFERLCVMLGQPALPRDPRFASAEERPQNIPVVLELATAWFKARPFDKAIEELNRFAKRLGEPTGDDWMEGRQRHGNPGTILGYLNSQRSILNAELRAFRVESRKSTLDS